ncbi:MAG TPA: hypothetical protein VGD54_16480 [Steroidobacteraceae bacterium]
MAEIGKFTQPDSSPQFFIDFLDFLAVNAYFFTFLIASRRYVK